MHREKNNYLLSIKHALYYLLSPWTYTMTYNMKCEFISSTSSYCKLKN